MKFVETKSVLLLILRHQVRESFRELWTGFCIKISPEVSNNILPHPLTFTGHTSRFYLLVTVSKM